MHLDEPSVLKQAYEKQLLTKQEYEKSFKGMFYDEYGSDSFIQYLNAAMNSEADCFITENERLLRRKDEFKTRFGMRIATPAEILKETEK